MEVFGLFGIIISFLPFILSILVIRWIFFIKKNSDELVRQNNEMIALLKRNRS